MGVAEGVGIGVSVGWGTRVAVAVGVGSFVGPGVGALCPNGCGVGEVDGCSGPLQPANTKHKIKTSFPIFFIASLLYAKTIPSLKTQLRPSESFLAGLARQDKALRRRRGGIMS